MFECKFIIECELKFNVNMIREASKILILLTLCIGLLQVSCYPYKNGLNHNDIDPNDLIAEIFPAKNIAKKDIFMSRGWGAAGMPYSMYYLDKPLSYQQRHKNRPNTLKSDSNAMYANQPQNDMENGDENGIGLIEANNFEALRSPSAEDSVNKSTKVDEKLRKLSSPPKNKYTIPQLFISYGWGPMG
uniref:CSON015223 protein n=1 Tax=Culicoides sonorensis TaxID=179676 RepID=A0A336MFF4_CULSO